jgi:hypothetical protein
MLRVSHAQALNFRLAANNLSARLRAGSYPQAAFARLQDSGPRDALIGLHARVTDCEPSAWEDPRLIQTYSPRQAVYVLPRDDFAVFTIGRLPRDDAARRAIEDQADQLAAALARQPRRPGQSTSAARLACATGRFVVRWSASSLDIAEQPPPQAEPEAARRELARRHLHAFGPTTPATFAWWAGLPGADASHTFDVLAPELTPVDLAGHPAWILTADEDAVTSSAPMRGVRFLAAPELRLFGQDRTGLFAGPGLAAHSPLGDRFHPGGLLVDGAIAGVWGRRGGRIAVKTAGQLPASMRSAIRQEGESMPVPGYEMTLSVTAH